MSKMTSRLPFAARSIAKIARARTFERLGSRAYSFPALFDLDRKVKDLLPTSPGVFLEIGANDGYSQSNTYALERCYGWSGILIEPIPRLFSICRRHRTRSQCYNLACVGPHSDKEVFIENAGLTSSIAGSGRTLSVSGRRPVWPHGYRVPADTLSAIIDKSRFDRIDFMSIDVEGAELDVLAGLDLDRHTPRMLLIETSNLDAVRSLVSEHLLFVDQLSHHDYLFASRR